MGREPPLKSMGVVRANLEKDITDYLNMEIASINAGELVLDGDSCEDAPRIKKFYNVHKKATKDALNEYKYKCMTKGFTHFHDSKCEEHPDELFEINLEGTDFECPVCSIHDRRTKYMGIEDEDRRKELLELIDEVERQHYRNKSSELIEEREIDELEEAAIRVEASRYLEYCKEESRRLEKRQKETLKKRNTEKALTKSERNRLDHEKAESARIVEENIKTQYIDLAQKRYEREMVDEYHKKRACSLDPLFARGSITLQQYIEKDDELFSSIKAKYDEYIFDLAEKMRQEDNIKITDMLTS